VFEEGNMANISPTIKIDISVKPNVVEEITWGKHAPLEEIIAYKALFQEYRDVFSWSYTEIPGLDPTIVEHRIDTWPDVAPVAKRNTPFTLPNPWRSKLRSTNSVQLASYTPLHTHPGFPTMFWSIKNKAPFAFALTL
jgi:hypothetical protein